MTTFEITQTLREIVALLSWGGVPHLAPHEMQHRANEAWYTAREAIRKIESEEN